MKKIREEWEQIDKNIKFKIALGKKGATWEDKSKYGFKSMIPEDLTFLKFIGKLATYTAYKCFHPIKTTKGEYYSMGEINKPSDIF
ncbi:MAG TPA: hypothetical protein ENG87_04310 [Candidatus Pacearchaeota archaeon]|nr:hypothetical protein [Candidatus Pacearchaeota archaeon]HDZ60513.1 hypothetical protein [Candidatus Pacearchaeota archaeon]